MIEEYVFYSCFCSLLLLIWFNSTAAEEYISLFKLGSFFNLPAFERKRIDDPELTYPDFLVIYHNNYFTRLLSCPLCITVWFHILSYFYHSSLKVSVISAVLTLMVYNFTKGSQEE